MEQQILSFAAGLKSLGLEQGERVSLFSENSCRWIVADQGIMMCGAADAVGARQLPPPAPPAEKQPSARACPPPPAGCALPPSSSRLNAGARLFCITPPPPPRATPQVRGSNSPAEELCYILGNSGSSGLVVQDVETLQKVAAAANQVRAGGGGGARA